MNSISVSQLKTNPSQFILQANDYPIPIEKRNKIEAYLIGSVLFDKIVGYLEDKEDQEAVKTVDFNKGRKLKTLSTELGI